MTSGIILLAFGKRGYGFMAYNLALSIKKHSPNVPITLYAQLNSDCMKEVTDLSVFDTVLPIEGNVSDPGRFKVSIYNLLPYDNNLYLDVDALCLKPIEPLMERLCNGSEGYQTYLHTTYGFDAPNDLPLMYWATKMTIWNHYGLNKHHKLPASQSSIQFIRKSEASKSLFETIESCFDNPIPIEKLKHVWGGTQPDELYINTALAIHGLSPHIGFDSMWFGDNQSKRPHVVANDHYFLSMFGNRNKVKPMFWEYYDKVVESYSRERGRIPYKSTIIKSDKHANGSMPVRRNMKRVHHIKPVSRPEVPIPPVPVQLSNIDKSKTVYLFTSYYHTEDQKRSQELTEVMGKNVANPHIDKIINLGNKRFENEKVLNIPFERPLFSDFVKAANVLKGDVSIIANSDIFFDYTIEMCKENLDEHTCYALSRYDVKEKNRVVLFNYEYSQDTWIFKGSVKPLENIDFVMGVPACDNRFAFELEKAGYKVLNPAFIIKTYHLHFGKRNYTEADRLKGEVIPVYVTNKLKYDNAHSAG